MEKKKFKQKTLSSNHGWIQTNQARLEGELALLRLLLKRHILWLREQWKQDPLQNHKEQVISDFHADWLLRHRDYTAQQEFYKTDAKAKEISLAIENLKEELGSQAKALNDSGFSTALDLLVRLFGLNEFDRAIILLCLAPEIDPAFESLYAYVQDDIARKYVTPHLVFTLFAPDIDTQAALKERFLPGSPLSGFKLVDIEESHHQGISRASSPLRLEPGITDYLQGFNRLDERAADILELVPAVESLPPSYCEIIASIQGLIETDDNERKSLLPALNFTGSMRSSKKDVASGMCDRLGIKLFALDPGKLFASRLKPHLIVPVLERECILLQAALYIDTSQLKDNNDPSKPLLDQLIDKLRTFFIVSSISPMECERELLNISIPKLNAGEQSTLWKQQLDRMEVSFDGRLHEIVQQFDFEPGMIKKVVTAARRKAGMRAGAGSNPTFNDIMTTCLEQSRNHMEGLAQRILPCFTWEDIVLPKCALEQLEDIAAQVAHRAFVYETWGFGDKLSRGRGISALFSGPSGTGKTMAAEILANHLKLDLFRIDLSAVVSKYIGETEKNLRRVFDAAENSGAILFFDEADALFGKRSEVKDSHDRYANIEINYLLQRMEDYRGLAILATNMKSLLDQAFLRRLRFHVQFPFPDAQHRMNIWKKVFPEQVAINNLDYDFLVHLEIPGGNIKNIALNAAFIAANDGRVISMNHILKATKREYGKIGKMVLESEFGSYYERVKQ